MKTHFRSRSIATVAFFAAAVFLFAFLFPSRPGEALPLPSSSEAYWKQFVLNTRGLDTKRLFPEGIHTNAAFGEWMLSETNGRLRSLAASVVVSVDGTNSLRFLEWMERVHPEWKEERELAVFSIANTIPYWDEHRPKKWNREEIRVISAYFRRRFASETNLQCRVGMDRFFLNTDPDWKPSAERLSFLEKSLSLCRNEGASNTILRIIATRTKPVDVEQYERYMQMIRH